MSACSHAGDEVIETFGKIGKDFLGGSFLVNIGICFVFKLLRNPHIVEFLCHFLRFFYGTRRSQFFLGKHKLCAVRRHQFAALHTHAFWHHQHEFVTFHGAHHSEPDARIARSRLYNQRVFVDFALPFSFFNHREGNSVLNASTGILFFEFHPYFYVLIEKFIDSYRGSIPDGFQNIVQFHIFCF